VLSPLLFIIYIADITDIYLSDCSMTIYIDDIMLYHLIHITDIDKLCTWSPGL